MSPGRDAERPVAKGPLLATAQRHLVLLVMAVTLPALAVLVRSDGAPVGYTASAQVHFATRDGGSTKDLSKGAVFVERQVSSLALVAVSDRTLQPILDRAGSQETVASLAGRLDVEASPSSYGLTISTTSAQASSARNLAEAVATSLVATVEDVASDRRGDPVLRATVIGLSVEPTTENVPWLRAGIAGAAGLLLALGWVLWRYGTDGRLRSPADIAEVTTAPLVAELDGRLEDRGLERLGVNVVSSPSVRASRVLVVVDVVPGRESSRTAIELARLLGATRRVSVLVPPDRVSEIDDVHGAVTRPSGAELPREIARRLIDDDLVIVSWPDPPPSTEMASLADTPHALLIAVTLGRTSGDRLAAVLRTAESHGVPIIGLATRPARLRRTRRGTVRLTARGQTQRQGSTS